jgi:hypothetical protein
MNFLTLNFTFFPSKLRFKLTLRFDGFFTTKSHVLWDTLYLYIPKWNDVGHPVSPETNSTSDSSMMGHVENRMQAWSTAE